MSKEEILELANYKSDFDLIKFLTLLIEWQNILDDDAEDSITYENIEYVIDLIKEC